jgi:integrase
MADYGSAGVWNHDGAPFALRRVLHRQHQQPTHPSRLCPRLRTVLRLVRAAQPDAGFDQTVRLAAWVNELRENHGAPGVKQQLAAVRMLFDWLITGQVVPFNPAAVRGPKHVVKTGKTPVLDGTEWRKLIDSIPIGTMRDLRDRALIATLTYSFARITAALRMKVEDLRPQGAGWRVQLQEKGGKQHALPCHHALAEALRAYIDAAGIAEDRKGAKNPPERSRHPPSAEACRQDGTEPCDRRGDQDQGEQGHLLPMGQQTEGGRA